MTDRGGGGGDEHPLSVQILSFLCSFRQIIGFCPKPMGWCRTLYGPHMNRNYTVKFVQLKRTNVLSKFQKSLFNYRATIKSELKIIYFHFSFNLVE